ncbi:tetraprenyl-beta-curcumene synthase family protein [Metabacillus iocasae]|uniref:Tetraprenyl-beta-curcumene synthase n=1 Tax=Priestia iocasae TaxID=2291674 RepID=A0ABS2R0T9_9BACI|nr:tetraprenyl-beta-curcumene synthase family protein [Metabacillus iocasae]MBM7704847.1 tetraprenyl-beta-curcumene synthase [Metabacillus iocasae]
MKIPSHPFWLMKRVYKDILPIVHKELAHWRAFAEKIPNDELRKQALASINEKTFHCEGGGILAILAKEHMSECVRFIVAYQTISDYLDNLCDRSNSLDPHDFAALHESMPDALTIGAPLRNYYRFREDQDDGGYLAALVQTCQQVLTNTLHYPTVSKHLLELAAYYCDLQVHKHVKVEERVPRLESWFSSYKKNLPKMEWYEFSACSGSTLGIFCLVAYSFQSTFTEEQALKVKSGYFPYIQGLHILLDYFIDQEEDKAGGDLNFCFYYPHYESMMERFLHFVTEADSHIKGLPNESFHRFINRGLLGVYLSDDKVRSQKEVHTKAKQLIKSGGKLSYFFYVNGRLYRMLSRS